jgi:hypothetical protein
MPSWQRYAAALCLVAASCGRSFAAAPANACSASNFGQDGAALYQAASEAATAKPGVDIVVLCDSETYLFDATGKSVHTQYSAYKVVTQSGADGWDSVAIEWQPWHEERPTMRARVITPDGAVHVLDQKTISDAPARDDDEKTYGDGRIERAPLPAIAPGSVIEEEEVSTESAPFFGAGTVQRDYFGRTVPVTRTTLLLDFPATLPMHYLTQLLPNVQTTKSEGGGRIQVAFDQGSMDAIEEAETLLPTEVPAHPLVVFSTGASWQTVAAGYEKIVDEKIVPKEAQQLVDRLTVNAKSSAEKEAAILQFLSREVRYTGVEFGDAAIVPHPPSETLKRKYGDCKDKATLAVAMLRAANIPAYVALLNVGRRQDVEPELPGMGLFDHAIVYIPGAPDVWVDATDEYARLGQLPADDQGRWALIARAQTSSLLRIPEARSSENLLVQKRDFYLAESGPARIVETTFPLGVFEPQYRSWYAALDDKKLQKNSKEYIEGQYLSEKVLRTDMSNPADLNKPFELTVEAGEAKRGFTELDSATAAIRLESFFDKLPDELQEAEKPERKRAEGDKDKPHRPRQADYLLPEAFVNQWEYKIIPPAGFQAKQLPPNAKMPAGPALFTEDFSLNPDGSVSVILRFDTTKRRLTIPEATELRTKIGQLRGEQAIFINFEPKSQALLNQGKAREAFQATRELIAWHPKEAVHHLQRANSLLAAGMGQAARDEARLAAQLEPHSALVQKTLARVLEFDLVGRQHRRGSDYDGAEAAFLAAEKLDPDDKTIVGNFAILLEYNHEGERYGVGAKLPQAIAQYRSLKPEELTGIGLQNNLAFALFYAHQFAEAKKSAESVNPQINSIAVASAAAMDGAEAGKAEARKRTSNDAEFQELAKTSGDMLMRNRLYPQAAELLAAGASGSNASATMGLASVLRKMHLHEELSPENSPTGVISEVFLVMMDPQITLEKFMAINSKNSRKSMRDSDVDGPNGSLHAARTLRSALSRTAYNADVMLDLILAGLQMQPEGDDASGYRVNMTPLGAKKTAMYVVKENGRYLMLDSQDAPGPIGLEILDRVEAQDVHGARVLLDWVRESQHLPGGDDPVSGSAFPRLWTKGKDATPPQIKLAAAAILADNAATAAQAIPILEPAKTASGDAAEKLSIDIGLLNAYFHAENYDRLYVLASEMAEAYPESKRVFSLRETALRHLARSPEADQRAQEMSKRLPDDVEVQREFVFNAVAREDYKLAHQLGGQMVASGKAEASDLNGLAWNSLFTGAPGKEDLDAATRSVQMAPSSFGNLHTLGCVYAEMGNTKEAREVLIQAMDALKLDEPEDNSWYAFGRIAEQYGETSVAAADYKRINKPKQAAEIAGSSYRLAQLRLAAQPH